MEKQILQLFDQHPGMALSISILISIVIAVLGVLPSVFVTAANIMFFGFWQGTAISFLGEAIGAAVAFALYRFGFKKNVEKSLLQYPRVMRLVGAENKEAFSLIFSLRLIPFVPSGLITFAGAVGKVSLVTFFIASSLGKIPALLMEAYAVYQVTTFTWQGKLLLALLGVGLVWYVANKIIRKKAGKTGNSK